MRSNGNEFKDAGIALTYSQSRKNERTARRTPKNSKESNEDRLHKGTPPWENGKVDDKVEMREAREPGAGELPKSPL